MNVTDQRRQDALDWLRREAELAKQKLDEPELERMDTETLEVVAGTIHRYGRRLGR